jgi:hypothetical protein
MSINFGPRTLLLTAAAGLIFPAAMQAQQLRFNEREAAPSLHVQDKDDIWTLNFRFKDPRMLVVNIPGRGQKVVWYMWYQLINNDKTPHSVILDFDLVTRDKGERDKFLSFHDEILPAVQEEIRKIEDPTDRFHIQNTVTIGQKPIPVSKPDAAPRTITGVAIWPDVFDKARDTTHFDIFVSGLSSGWSIDDQGKIRRKTLQLEFKRLGDGSRVDNNEFKFVDSKWFYRETTANVGLQLPPSVQPEAAPAAPPAEPKKDQ